jgi:hypothetical protein
LAEFRESFANTLGDTRDPWQAFNELVAATGAKGVVECRPFTRELLAVAADACADRSLGEALQLAEGGNWVAAAAVARRAADSLDTHFTGQNNRVATPTSQAPVFVALGFPERATEQIPKVANALERAKSGDETALRQTDLSVLSPELARPIRSAITAEELRTTLAQDKLPSAKSLLSLLDTFANPDQKLAARVRVETAGQLLLEGRPSEARQVLGTSKGPTDPAIAANLLRDLKAVALGEGAVTTDAAKRAITAPGEGGSTPRGPPIVRLLTPEGEREGYRPPVVEKATADCRAAIRSPHSPTTRIPAHEGWP